MSPHMKFNIQPATLSDWRQLVLPRLREFAFVSSSIKDLTLLAYFFWDDERIETEFHTIECSFLCAYHALGLLPSVLVTNRISPSMQKFCDKFKVEIQVSPNLTGGLPAMSCDCIFNLHTRFKTENVLIIQNDGILVTPGIEAYLHYDYIGAPWPKRCVITERIPYKKICVGNGGLSLRTKRICKTAHLIGRLLLHGNPANWYYIEDTFYAFFVRLLSPFLLRFLRFAPPEVAARFAIENETPFTAKEPPLGFHGEIGFQEYSKRFGTPLQSIL